ncbi:MAG TPA: hypothetical protein DDX39_12825 [Bacteroidales bacterium]|nr:hypothetical protein [Bacteroidales bacterium]
MVLFCGRKKNKKKINSFTFSLDGKVTKNQGKTMLPRTSPTPARRFAVPPHFLCRSKFMIVRCCLKLKKSSEQLWKGLQQRRKFYIFFQAKVLIVRFNSFYELFTVRDNKKDLHFCKSFIFCVARGGNDPPTS